MTASPNAARGDGPRTGPGSDVEGSLRAALTGAQFQVHYQPIVELRSGRLVGTEALVRWEHPTRGLVAPDEFISIAEETGLIIPLGAWVLRRAAQQTKAWQQRPGCGDLSVAVNLSAVQLRQPDLVDMIAAILGDTELAAGSLELEITESAVMADAARALVVLGSLKALGVRLSIDDFGTGYSSLSRLKRLPVDAVKIDRSFVDGLGQDVADSAIVDAIIGMADALHLETVAEGVETPLQMIELTELGCTYAQGYLFARPAPAEVLDLMLDEGLRLTPRELAAVGDGRADEHGLAADGFMPGDRDADPGSAHRPRRSVMRKRTRRPVAPVAPIVPPQGWRRTALTAGAVGITYGAVSQYIVWLNDPVNAGAAFWPAAGVTLAALLLSPRRAWLPILLAVAAAEIGGGLAHGYPAGGVAFWAAGNVIEPFIGAALIRGFRPQAVCLAPLDNLLAFLVLGVIAGPVVGGSIGSLGSVLWFDHSLWNVWPKYLVGDALGVLVVAPLVLHAATLRLPRQHVAEAAILGLMLAAVGGVAFSDWRTDWSVALPYVLIPVLLWAALRFGIAATAVASFIVAQGANLATAHGWGPFAFVGDRTGHAVTFLQIYLGIAIGTALVLAAMASDLVSRRELELKLTHRATHDQLTGLPNRARAYSLLERSLARARNDNTSVAVLFCDLDGFKEINDTLGHEWGDRVLVATAERLLGTSRVRDLVGRVGGDEFLVVCPDIESIDVAVDVVQRLEVAIRAPIVHEGQTVEVSVSIGLASTDGSTTVDEIVGEADAEMYVAKRRGTDGHPRTGLRTVRRLAV